MNDEKLPVWQAALAGLLHDIGKFAQRANIGLSENWNRETKSHPYSPGRQHALYSGDFVDRYVPEAFKPLSPPAYHHAPQSHLDRLVQLADHLSAGERDADDKRYPKQLLSIFCRVQVDGKGQPPASAGRYHSLALLALSEALFPTDETEREDIADHYKALWDGEERRAAWPGFVKEAETLRKAHSSHFDPATYLENMLLLMQRYTWCIPSAYYNNVPDVSLYDHSRTTAAIAACLTAHSDAQIQRWLEKQDRDKPVALLVGGDLSGVQDFIYTITSQGAASALRGRSLYLQLLSEAAARYVLRRLGLPITNLLFAGGGHLFLLARHSDGDELDKIRQDISRILLAFHSGDLYLALESVPLAARAFSGQRLPGKWQELGAYLRRAKTRKFSELGEELHALLFDPHHDQGNQEQECQVCGREHPDTKKDGEVRKCPPCRDFEALGKDLRQARYLRLSEVDFAPVDHDALPGKVEDALRCFGMAAKLDEHVPDVPEGAHRSTILALRDGAMDELKPGARIAAGRRFFVNVTPQIAGIQELMDLQGKVRDLPGETEVRNGAVKPFEALEYHARGIKRLGVLRMDVDDMGKIISEGLGELATLSRIATLSFMVNLFFEGWAAELARQYNRSEDGTGQDRVYSIYAGGDDLLFVGAWDVMPELALKIRNDWQRFVAGRPDIHASAGIALVGGRYPLYRAAGDARDALDAAKARPGKNALHFLDRVVAWDKFADQVQPTAGRLASLVESRRAPRALLQKLAQFHRLYTRQEKALRDRGEGVNKPGQPQVYWGPWNWRSAYYLKRIRGQGEEAEKEIDNLRQSLGGDNFSAIEWIGLAARWADLLTR